MKPGWFKQVMLITITTYTITSGSRHDTYWGEKGLFLCCHIRLEDSIFHSDTTKHCTKRKFLPKVNYY